MLALADHANGERVCWPSVKTLAKQTRLSDRQARRLLGLMAKQGHIIVKKNAARRGTNLYEIPSDEAMASLADLDTSELRGKGSQDATDDTPDADDTPDTGGTTPVTGGHKPLSPVTPEPSVTVKEPSSVDAARPASLDKQEPLFPLADSSARDESGVCREEEERQGKSKGSAKASNSGKPKPSRSAPKYKYLTTPAQRRELCAYFCLKAEKSLPDTSQGTGYGEIKKRWDMPLDTYYRWMGENIERVKDAIDFALAQFKDKTRLVAPASLYKIIEANRERIPYRQAPVSVADGVMMGFG